MRRKGKEMTLKDFLESLKTDGVLVTVSDRSNNQICKLYSTGVGALDDTIEARTVEKWTIDKAQAISVVLND